MVILFDFDGVIIDSMNIREEGFRKVLKDYPENQVNDLIDFHIRNGGLSRYVKFRYFFSEIRKESVKDNIILRLADAFSVIMLKELCRKDLLIKDCVDFIKHNYLTIPMHIVSGSDQKELRIICEALDLSKYFWSGCAADTNRY